MVKVLPEPFWNEHSNTKRWKRNVGERKPRQLQKARNPRYSLFSLHTLKPQLGRRASNKILQEHMWRPAGC